jgi:hypothetical protein
LEERKDVEAGGNAMKRPLGLGLVLLALPVLLPGVSGCAGLPQRLSLSSPATTGSDGVEAPATNRFSWWRGERAAGSKSDLSSNLAENARSASPAGAAMPGDVWPETRSEWLARHFPLLSRSWSGYAADPVGNGAVSGGRLQGSGISSRSSAADDASTARADGDVRPVKTSSDEGAARSGETTDGASSQRNQPPRVPTLLGATNRGRGMAASGTDVERDVSGSPPSENDPNPALEGQPAAIPAEPPAQDSTAPPSSDVGPSQDVATTDRPAPALTFLAWPAEPVPGRLMAMASGSDGALAAVTGS